MKPACLAMVVCLFLGRAWADDPLDAGAPLDASPATDVAPARVAAPLAAPRIDLVPRAAEERPQARPIPLHRSALFWTTIAVGAGALATLIAGVTLAATVRPPYAIVKF